MAFSSAAGLLCRRPSAQRRLRTLSPSRRKLSCARGPTQRRSECKLAAAEENSEDDVQSSPSMRVWAMSDLHVDNAENRKFVMDELCGRLADEQGALLVPGDISHDLDLLELTLSALVKSFRRVFFVCGNHELWTHKSVRRSTDVATDSADSSDSSSSAAHAETAVRSLARDSLQKWADVNSLCERVGVCATPHRLGDNVLIAGLHAWYDLSLEISVEPQLMRGFGSWPWTDFVRCAWPDSMLQPYDCRGGKYPSGAAKYFADANERSISACQQVVRRSLAARGSAPHVITFSHFLPGVFALPDWMDPDRDEFDRSWLNHRAASIAAKFSRVAGSSLVEEQLRRAGHGASHTHVFGHSHRPKDFLRKGVRYVHQPLGKPLERKLHLAQPDAAPKLLCEADGRPLFSEQRIIRYWQQTARGPTSLTAPGW